MSNVERIQLQEPRLPFGAASERIQDLRQENARLETIVTQLAAIIAKNVAAQK